MKEKRQTRWSTSTVLGLIVFPGSELESSSGALKNGFANTLPGSLSDHFN